MKLKDFMASGEAAAHAADGNLPREAGKIFNANYAAPEHTTVRFTFSAVVDGTHPRPLHFNLLLKITPDHPYFRPYLRDWAIRKTCHLCLFDGVSRYREFSYCQYGPDTELDKIVDDTEQCILDRVVQFEKCLHTLNEISAQHGLSPQEMSGLMDAMDYMIKHSQYNRDYLLSAENRKELLQMGTLPGPNHFE